MMRERWDMVIAAPPCTFLSAAGTQYVMPTSPTYRPERLESVHAAAEFFLECLAANAPFVAVENPRMHPIAREIIGPSAFRVQPWHFGDDATKATHFWTRGPLPPLMPTRMGDRHGWSMQRVNSARRIGTSQWRIARRTPPGMAAAMAAQWGTLQMPARVTDSGQVHPESSRAGSVTAALQLQAVTEAVSGLDAAPGLRPCSHCGRPFLPKRWVNEGEAYCRNACRQAAFRRRHRGER